MLTAQKTPRPSITPAAGQIRSTRLLNGTQTHRVLVTVSAELDITAVGTAVRNRGSIFACLEECRLEENGKPVAVLDGRVLRYLTELQTPGGAASLGSTRLGSTAIQTVTLTESAIVHLAHPYSVNPRETAYLERDPRSNLEFQVRQVSDANPADRILTGGTKTLGDITVRVQQIHDPMEPGLPYYAPQIRQFVETITASSSQFVSYIKTTHAIRGLVLQEDTNLGEVDDIINAVGLLSDGRHIIGPTPMPKADIQADAAAQYGAPVVDAYTPIMFQDGGRLANLVHGTRELNLRLEMDVQPSVTAGVTRSQVRVTLLELTRDNYVDPQSGRRVVSPELPPGLV